MRDLVVNEWMTLDGVASSIGLYTGVTCLDITRLREDTGFRPAYGLERGVRDYIAWLANEHER